MQYSTTLTKRAVFYLHANIISTKLLSCFQRSKHYSKKSRETSKKFTHAHNILFFYPVHDTYITSYSLQNKRHGWKEVLAGENMDFSTDSRCTDNNPVAGTHCSGWHTYNRFNANLTWFLVALEIANLKWLGKYIFMLHQFERYEYRDLHFIYN